MRTKQMIDRLRAAARDPRRAAEVVRRRATRRARSVRNAIARSPATGDQAHPATPSRRRPKYTSAQWQLVGDVMPDDSAEQVSGQYYVDYAAAELADGAVVVDLGCGLGRSRGKFRRANKTLRWVGVDIPGSPEGSARSNDLPGLTHFDGIRIPFADGSVDCVFSQQVMEHVRYPEELLAEVCRVLRPGGLFVGSTSNLEPYHSYSYWNFTPFGFRTIVDDAGLQLVEFRPGIDGPTLVERQFRNRPPELSKFFSETSPINAEVIAAGRKAGLSNAEMNSWMMHFSGHFGFVARRP